MVVASREMGFRTPQYRTLESFMQGRTQLPRVFCYRRTRSLGSWDPGLFAELRLTWDGGRLAPTQCSENLIARTGFGALVFLQRLQSNHPNLGHLHARPLENEIVEEEQEDRAMAVC